MSVLDEVRAELDELREEFNDRLAEVIRTLRAIAEEVEE
jgi:hypothetical protein